MGEAVALAIRFRNICWFLLTELGRHHYPQPATQRLIQLLEEEHPWVTGTDNTALAERLTEEEWKVRNADTAQDA